MEEKRKPRPWGLWIVAGLVLLVAYPLSAPPATRLMHKRYIPHSARHLFQPVYSVVNTLPDEMQQIYYRYYDWWNPPSPLWQWLREW